MGRITEEKGKFLYPILSERPTYLINHLRYNFKNIAWEYNKRAKRFCGKKLRIGRMYVRGNQAIIELAPGIRVNLLTRVLEGYISDLTSQGCDVRLPLWS